MQEYQLRQKVHDSFLPPPPSSYTPARKAVCLCDLLEEICPRLIPERTHVYSHGTEALQMPLRGMYQGLQTGGQAIHAQEVPLEQNLHCAQNEEES